MKIQTQAILKALTIDDQDVPLDDQESIYLEFSAIDTGGGFKDPMLDFSISGPTIEVKNHRKRSIMIVLADPADIENEVELSYKGEITIADNEMNGRVTEEQLSREVVRFVFALFN